MKKIYSTLFFLALAAISFSQPYYIYTAKASGYWYNAASWDIQPRMDGKAKHKVIIPKAFNIVVDNNVNNMGLGNVEIFVSGGLSLVPNTTLTLSGASSIQLDNGSISGSTADQKILIGSTVKYQGNLDAVKKEYSIADNTTGVSPNGFSAFASLPVNFTSFYINKTSQNIQLSWSTGKEMNNSHFEVERSVNGVEWTKIAMVVGAGSTNAASNYNYTDKLISSAAIYYRLRQVDVDGRSTYSSIKTIKTGEAISAMKVYGFQKNVVIDLNASLKDDILVSVMNSNGQVITQKSFSNPSYKITMNLNTVTTGSYIVRISDSKGLSEVKKVVL